MRRITLIALLLPAALFMGCSGHGRYHDAPLGDPSDYRAHFPDMDGNGDGRVDPTEFKAHFPDSNDHVYQALDVNGDGVIDHDEWHQFKEAHGIEHHD